MKPFVHKFDPFLRKQSCIAITALALGCVILLGIVDHLTDPQLSLAIFYLLPIALAAWYGGKASGLLISIASAIPWLTADFASTISYSHPTVPYWNSLVRLALFLIVVCLLATVKRLNENLETAVEQKTAALNAEMQERSRVEQAVLEISGQEQRRIAHELHDGLGQHLTYAAFKAKILAQDLAAAALPQALPAEEIVKLLNQGTQQVRKFARGLDPIDVEASGLTAAIERLVKETETLRAIRCGFTFSRVDLPLERSASLQLYRIVQEAINNAIKHGQPRNVEVELNVLPGELSLKITDDGVGFEIEEQTDWGMGIEIMRYRARTLGGVLTIIAAPKRGTTVHCQVPTATEEASMLGKDLPHTNHNAKEVYSSR